MLSHIERAPAINGGQPVLSVQTVGAERYLGFSGLPGRVFLEGR